MVTVRAQPAGGTQESVDYRITVVTSTLWGVAGVALIAVAVEWWLAWLCCGLAVDSHEGGQAMTELVIETTG